MARSAHGSAIQSQADRLARAGSLAGRTGDETPRPVGLDFGTNHPHEIALSIAAQLITEHDKRRKARR